MNKNKEMSKIKKDISPSRYKPRLTTLEMIAVCMNAYNLHVNTHTHTHFEGKAVEWLPFTHDCKLPNTSQSIIHNP